MFAEGFSLGAAEAICSPERAKEGGNITLERDHPDAIEVLKGIEALVAKNLVQQTESGEGTGSRA